MTDLEIEALYWATCSQYSAMANHIAVIIAFARRVEAAALATPTPAGDAR